MSASTERAPIVLFVYKRPEHAARAIASLLACEGMEGSPLYVFADGAKSEADVPAVLETRRVVRHLLGSRVEMTEQETNRGLAASIIAGTTEVCDRHGSAIVVEDDLIVAPSFLRFLNDGLQAFRNQSRVMQVSGHMFDVPSVAISGEPLFLPMTSSWGWATWKRAWDLFDPNATGWQELLSGETLKRFNLDGNYDYGTMLRRQMTRGIDSWAIRWYYTIFVHEGLTLFPPLTLARHAGADRSGTHGRFRGTVVQQLPEARLVWTMPGEVVASRFTPEVFAAIGRRDRPSVWRNVKTMIASGLKRASQRPEETRDDKP